MKKLIAAMAVVGMGLMRLSLRTAERAMRKYKPGPARALPRSPD